MKKNLRMKIFAERYISTCRFQSGGKKMLVTDIEKKSIIFLEK